MKSQSTTAIWFGVEIEDSLLFRNLAFHFVRPIFIHTSFKIGYRDVPVVVVSIPHTDSTLDADAPLSGAA